MRTFQPIDVPGCALWLDAADQSSMTLSASSVTQWNDKSGNGRNVIQTTTTPTDRRPTYSNGVLNFNGANFLSGTNTFSVVNSGTLFAVARHSSTRGRVIDIRNNTMGLGIEFGTTPDLFFHNSFGRWGQSFTDGTNDLQIIVNTRNGSSAPQYARNGGSLISFTSSQSTPADNGSYFAVGYDPTGAQYLNGVLCEIIYYSNFLTTSQRQQVEGYLAHKWGLTLSLPVISPLSIPGCQLWLDGADPVGNGVQPSNGATVSTWVDKSGNGYNATTASSRIAGTYSTSLRAVNFVTSNTGYVTSYTAAPTNETMFVVTNNSSLTINNFIIIGGQSGARSLSVASTPNGLGSIGNLKNAIAFLARTGAGTYTAGTTVMVTSQFTSSTNSISLNGGTAENGGAPEFTAGTTTYLGVDTTSPNFYYIGYAMEILFYNSVLTTTQRQQVEGYLARKWGISISATLPSPHPFKSFPPATLPFSPRNISGCQLWLDAADQSSMTLSGSSVIVWNDKSGNGYHMNTLTPTATWTGSATYPTIGTSINGLQTVNFVAQSGLKQGTTLDGVKNFFWVGRIAAPIGSGDVSFFLLGHDTHFDWHSNQYGGRFVHPELTQTGIYNASPTSLFTSDSSAVTNAPFSSVNMPSAPNVSLLSVAGITGTTRYQGICYDRNANLGWCGDLAEVVIFNSALTTSQRQQVEGYLAQKWGLTGSLPSTHPYKKLPA